MDVSVLIGLGGLPAIMALTQMWKGIVSDTRYYPLISVAMGLVVNILAAFALSQTTGRELAAASIQGLIAGLAAAGLYSWGSTLKEGAAADKSNRVPPPPPSVPGTPPIPVPPA